MATVTIGETFVPDSVSGGSGVTYLQSGSPGGKYAVPYSGVITSWSYQAAAISVPTLKFKVGRAAGGSDFLIVGSDDPRTPTASTLSTFPTQIPVQPGDVIGHYKVAGGFFFRTAPGYSAVFGNGDPAAGTNFTSTGLSPDTQLDLSATLEPTNTFTFGKTKRNKKRGTATLTVELPNPGELVASGKGVRSAGAAVAAKSVPAPGETKLVVKAKGKKRKTLTRTGGVSLKVKITYTPTGGAATSRALKLKLIKRG